MKLTGFYLILFGVIGGMGIGLLVGKLMYEETAPLVEKSTSRLRDRNQKETPARVKESIPSNTDKIRREARMEVEKTLDEIDQNVRSSIPDTMPLDSGVPVPKKRLELYPSADDLPETDDTPIVILSEEITVRSEMLLGEAYAEVIRLEDLDSEPEGIRKQDSLVEKISDIKTVNRKQYKIQFWESPVNYSGYKMANNNVVVYGLDPVETIRILNWKEKLYLDYEGRYYQLIETYDYQPLILVKEEHLILLFNESRN